jgi:hypothetical protein
MTGAAFLAALGAEGPAPDRAEAMALYGRFVGSWDLDVTHVLEDGTVRRRPGTWHFGWVLKGRAIQDVWILPARPGEGEPEFYGTTLRVWDPRIGAWHIRYADPAAQVDVSQTGRAEGPDIVQLGTDPDGTRRRWRFTDITPDSFRWRGEVADGEDGWRCHTDFTAVRRPG